MCSKSGSGTPLASRDGGRSPAGSRRPERSAMSSSLAATGVSEWSTSASLRFADVAEKWLEGPVSDLRPRTGECYRNALERHLLPRLGSRRLDRITPDDLADLVRDLRQQGLSESTASIAIGVTNRVYRFAARTAWLVRSKSGVADALVRAAQAIAVQAAADLRGRGARADRGRGRRPVADPVHPRRSHGRARLGAARAHLGGRSPGGPRRRADRVRVAGRPQRRAPADEDGRFGADSADPSGAGE